MGGTAMLAIGLLLLPRSVLRKRLVHGRREFPLAARTELDLGLTRRFVDLAQHFCLAFLVAALATALELHVGHHR
jgi:hypothetical protein